MAQSNFVHDGGSCVTTPERICHGYGTCHSFKEVTITFNEEIVVTGVIVQGPYTGANLVTKFIVEFHDGSGFIPLQNSSKQQIVSAVISNKIHDILCGKNENFNFQSEFKCSI